MTLDNATGKDINFKYNLGSTYVNAGKSKEATIEAGNVQATYQGKKIWEGHVSESDNGSTIVIS
ncbi:MAG: hypothetical protein N4A35_15170 [Flavobacteriales bacterium]|nr:hypothetical protein [Flavobacteriales bacterium]